MNCWSTTSAITRRTKSRAARQPGIQIERADHRFQRIGQHRGLARARRAWPRRGRRQQGGQAMRLGDRGERRLGDQGRQARARARLPARCGKRSISHSATISPSTRSPMNSSRSLEPTPFAPAAERCVSASASSFGRRKRAPAAPAPAIQICSLDDAWNIRSQRISNGHSQNSSQRMLQVDRKEDHDRPGRRTFSTGT